jgi:hypothetical protein
VLDLIRPKEALLVSILEKARPCDLEGDELTIGFAEDVAFRRKLEDPAKKKVVADAIREIGGHPVTVRYEIREEDEELAAGAPQTISEEDLVARLRTEFDAEEIVPDDPEVKT